MGQRHTVNFLNQHLGCHLAADYTIITCEGNSWSQVIMSCVNAVHNNISKGNHVFLAFNLAKSNYIVTREENNSFDLSSFRA